MLTDLRMDSQPPAMGSIPLFTQDELTCAIKNLPTGIAPGPDLVPNKIIKLTAKK